MVLNNFDLVVLPPNSFLLLFTFTVTLIFFPDLTDGSLHRCHDFHERG